MNQPEEPLEIPPEEDFSVPWTVGDTWLGLLLLVLITVGMLAAALVWQNKSFLQGIGLVIAELLYLVPVIFFMIKRRASWRALGFRSFERSKLALGCGLLVLAYMLIMVHNLILVLTGITTQGETLDQLFVSLDSPFWLVFVGVVLAPLIEETFFRGFLFAGFRQRFGWKKAALLASAIFAIAHLQPVALIPTFILGYLLAYLYQKSNSLWPGIILHFLVNSTGFLLIFILSGTKF